MRNSKAKQIRKALRAQGIPVGQARYENTPGTEKLKPVFDAKGNAVSTYTTVTKRLQATCGRAVYQRTKAAV